MHRKAVKIIRDPEVIKILSDQVRREILRFLAAKPRTETQLAEKLNLSKPSVGHHLQILLKAGLITVAKVKVGSHGIVEKYYEPTHTLFLEDVDSIPPNLRRYFIHRYIERLRGMLSAFQVINGMHEQVCIITPEKLEELAEEIARRTINIGEKYSEIETKIGRESLFIKICSETLRSIMRESQWKNFFAGVKSSPESGDVSVKEFY